MKKVIVYGTFDLFHIGHLNFIKRAKELGDYLIVGVSTDSFNEIKGKKAAIPFEQRKKIVESIEYVDEVIAENSWDQKVDDIKKYNIDIIATSPEWKERFDYLKDYAEVKYLEPTPDISSTLIRKELIESHREEHKLNVLEKGSAYAFKYILRFLYYFFKLLKIQDNKVVFISRRSNTTPFEFQMILEKLKNENVKTVVLCKKLNKTVSGGISYFFEILRQMYHLATSKVCVLDSYCIPASILNHKKDLKIMQTWHALMAVKKFGYQNLDNEDGRNGELANILEMHRNYDYVASGSKTMSAFFSEAFNTPMSKIHEVGSPTIDYLLRNKDALKEMIYTTYPQLKEKPTVLYVPTFRKNRTVKDNDLINNFDFEHYNLIIKYHPLSKKKVKNENIYTCREYKSLDLLTVADYIITDYSSIAAEASILNVPLLFYVYDLDDYKYRNGLNVNLYEEMPGCVFRNAKDLLDKIYANDFNYSDIENFRNKYVTNLNGTSSLLIVKYILENIWGYEYEESRVLSSPMCKKI